MKDEKRIRVKWGGLGMAACVVAGCVYICSGFSRDLFSRETNEIVEVHGSFLNSDGYVEQTTDCTSPWTLDNADSEAVSASADGIKYVGFSELSLDDTNLSKGALAICDEKHPATPLSGNQIVDVEGFSNEFYTAQSGLLLRRDAAEALNRLMAGYNKATGLDDFVVYSTTEPDADITSLCPGDFEESKTGYTVDLALYGYGSMLAYDGRDDEGWIIEHCHEYGFIVRYPKGKEDITGEKYCPWHLRYVGDLHAVIMHDKDMCLEEYVDYMEKYTFEEPFECSLNGSGRMIYCVPAEKDGTVLYVPRSEGYEISGDNRGTYIVTAKN